MMTGRWRISGITYQARTDSITRSMMSSMPNSSALSSARTRLNSSLRPAMRSCTFLVVIFFS